MDFSYLKNSVLLLLSSKLSAGETKTTDEDLFEYIKEKMPELRQNMFWTLYEMNLLLAEWDASDMIAGIRTSASINGDHYEYRMTAAGKRYVSEFMTYWNEPDNTDVAFLDAALPLLNLYGDVGLNRAFTKLRTHGMMGSERAIERYLLKNGYLTVVRANGGVFLELTDKGRLLVSAGSRERFYIQERDSVNEAEELKAQEIKRQELSDELLAIQKENAAWQKEFGNPLLLSNRRLTRISIIVASCSLLSTISIAYFVNRTKTPPVNNITVVLDTSIAKLVKQIPPQHAATANQDSVLQKR